VAIRATVVLILFLGAFYSWGETVDTVIVADGTPGPYRIGTRFVDSTTVSVQRSDSGYLAQFIYIGSTNGLLFSEAVDSGVHLSVRYEVDYLGLSKVYSLYEKRYYSPQDSTKKNRDSLGVKKYSLLQQDNLTVSGYKTIGMSVGSFGQLNLEQGLDVRIGGDIRPGTKLTAHLNDQGTSLEGTTREISEFDMIYIALEDRRFKVITGDQYVEWPLQGILDGRKKIKGVAATVYPGTAEVGAFGALAGGKFAVQTFRGDGGQGPYSFTGSGEAGFITPIGGTIRVTVNGELCKEGEDESYMVDYDLGTMTFTAKKLVNPEDIIRVEYEYKMFEYQRMLTGGTAGMKIGDSLFTIKGVIWSESDNKNNPIEQTLSSDNIRALRNSGDAPPLDTADYAVDPLDVLTRYASIPLYEKKDSLGSVIFVHRVPDPENPLKNDSLYEVHFSVVTDGCGDYERMTSDKYPDYVYRYAGPCNGSYTPLTPLSAPERRTVGEVETVLRLPLFQMKANIAGQEYDKNLFSNRDDNDNLASAATVNLLAGKRSFDKRSFWLSGNGQYWSSRFDREALSAYKRKNEWNDYSLQEHPVDRLQWETSVGTTPLPKVSTEMVYGQQRFDRELVTDKVSNRTRWHPMRMLHLDYDGSLFRHFEENGTATGWRQQTGGVFSASAHSAQLQYRDEWRGTTEDSGAGLIEGMLQYEFLPIHLQQQVIVTRFRGGKGNLFAAPDTGSSFIWKQSVDSRVLPWWHVKGTSSWQRRSVKSAAGGTSGNTTMLLDLNSETETKNRQFLTRQHYRTTAEKTSRYLQIPTYVGEGRGTHRWDSTMNEYVEDLHGDGDFIIQQRDVFDSTGTERLRKTNLTLTWEFHPGSSVPEGILRDLDWDGTLYCEEYINADEKGVLTWLPGYLSLRDLSSNNDAFRTINFSDLSYRQEVEWNPGFNRRLRLRLTATPEYRRIRSYREDGWTLSLQTHHEGVNLSIENDTRFLTLTHADTSGYTGSDFSLRDVRTIFTERVPFASRFEGYVKECLGWARQTIGTRLEPGAGLDSSLYVQLTPGIAWTDLVRGRVEAEYTFSLVTVPQEHDYRIAQGFASGMSHLITFMAHVRMGKYFSLNGSYRGEIFIKDKELPDRPARHVVSVEVQAYL